MNVRTYVDRLHPQWPIGKSCHCSAVVPTPQTGSTHMNPLAAALPSPWPFCHPLYSLLFQAKEHTKKGLHSSAESYSNMAELRFSINQGSAPPHHPFFSSLRSQHLNQSTSLTLASRISSGAILTPAQVNENQIFPGPSFCPHTNKKHQKTYPSRRHRDTLGDGAVMMVDKEAAKSKAARRQIPSFKRKYFRMTLGLSERVEFSCHHPSFSCPCWGLGTLEI